MTRRAIVILMGVFAIVAFAASFMVYDRHEAARKTEIAASSSTLLVRPHSPVIGPPSAPVTIVEFFDPSCESCRAFYPAVKQILATYPKDVRLVIRYTPLHEGSDEAIRILETARLQNLFEPVLEALLAAQPSWAIHGAPDLSRAWEVARGAGLDLARARRERSRPEITEVLRVDIADGRVANVRGTPTFFVNEKPLLTFGMQPLSELVRGEVERARQK